MSHIDLSGEGLFVTAELRLKDEVALSEGCQAILDFCAAMQQEPGCLLAHATQDPKDPRRFVLWEKYQDQAAFETHFAAEHTQAFIASGQTELIKAYETLALASDSGDKP